MIHAGLGPRVDYTVSARVINNPGNYPVNPEQMSISPTDLQHIAILRQQVLRASTNRIHSSEIMLTKMALMLAVRPSVAAWLTGKFNVQGRSVCVLNQKTLLQENLHEFDDRCRQVGQLVLRCRSEENLSNVWQATSEKFQSNLLLLYLADVISEQFQCAESAFEQIYIDYVPAKQHWLIRNGWLDWISVEHDAQCVQLPREPCRAIYFNLGVQETLLEPLIVRWVSE